MKAIFQTPIYGASSEAHMFSNSEYMQIILEDIENLKNSGVSKEDIEEVVKKYNLQDALEVQRRKRQIIQMDRQEFIEYIGKMENLEELAEEEFSLDMMFQRDFIGKFFGGDNIKPYDNSIYDILKSYAFLRQSHPEIDIDVLDITVFKNSSDDGLVIVYSDEDGIVAEVEKIIDIKNWTSTEEMRELQVKQNAVPNAEQVIIQPSRLKIIEERLRNCEDRYNRLKKLHAPQYILQKEEENIANIKAEYLEITDRIEQRRKRKELLSATIKLTETEVSGLDAVKGIVQGMENANETKEQNGEEEQL